MKSFGCLFIYFCSLFSGIYITCLIWETVQILSREVPINPWMTISGTMWWYRGTPITSTQWRLTQKSQRRAQQEQETSISKVSVIAIYRNNLLGGQATTLHFDALCTFVGNVERYAVFIYWANSGGKTPANPWAAEHYSRGISVQRKMDQVWL